MKAFICTRYGSPDVLHLAELATPSPGANEILIRTVATTVSAADRRIRAADFPRGFGTAGRLIFGITRPRQPILGSELAGVVEVVGSAATRFKPGDRVVAFPDTALGCHAEYVTMQEDGAVAALPPHVSATEAAALPFGGTTALSFLRKTGLERGESILVVGASGCVGSATVQLARHLGAIVTGLTSTGNVETVRSIGAHDVIDYTRVDITDCGRRWDVIIDTVGSIPYRRLQSALSENGRLALIAADLPAMLSAGLSFGSRQKVIAGPATGPPDDLRFLVELAETGIYRPLIDGIYTFAEVVKAHQRVDSGRKRGSVVISVAPDAA